MPHLLSPRKGWENERLASYLLSRFSFVAQPSSVADDLGSDFFCTIFDIAKGPSGYDVLRPLNSFAIQVKSSAGEISMDNKIDYLLRLELPFLIGVVSQSPSAMTIYSAELLPLLFSLFGVPAKLSLLPVEQSEIDRSHWYDDLTSDGGGIRLVCPSVATFRTEDDRPTMAPKVDTLHKICIRTHHNIAARVSEEHIYDVDGKGTFQIVSGPGSAMHFRMNFVKRLGEVFKNLDWILQDGQTDPTWQAEFECFDSFYKALRQLDAWSPMPAFVSVPYLALRQKLERRSK
jgi:hypothetical protein